VDFYTFTVTRPLITVNLLPNIIRFYEYSPFIAGEQVCFGFAIQSNLCVIIKKSHRQNCQFVIAIPALRIASRRKKINEAEVSCGIVCQYTLVEVV